LPRGGVGGNVIVGRLAAEKQIADASTGKVSLVPVFPQCMDDLGGVFLSAGHRWHQSLVSSKSRKLES
jgi:hypothetical protein